MACKVDKFTISELERLQKNLKRRFKKAKVVEVGFGPAAKNGKADSTRPFCVCFFVTNKRLPRNKDHRIPKVVNVRLKRRGKMVRFQLNTDVVETNKMKLTGRFTRRTSTTRKITAGSVVSWKEVGSTQRKYAVVTVAHHFPNTNPSNKNVLLHRTSISTIAGKFMFRSPRNSKIDAAVVSFNRSDLVIAGLIPGSSVPDKKPQTLTRLKNSIGNTGKSLIPPRNGKINLKFDHFFPENNQVAAIGKIKNVVRTTSATSGAFKGGRSGAIFVLNTGQVSAMQFAGITGNAKIGLGQAYETVNSWVLKRLKKKFNVVTNSFRLVAAF